MRRSGWAIPLLLLLLVQGCKQGSPGAKILSETEGGVELIVSVAPHSEGGLLITATANNNGEDTRRYTATCGRPDMEFRFFDAGGNELTVTNPCEPQPMMGCPTALGVPLSPDGSATTQHWWSGRLWDGCTSVEAAAGDYRVTVRFPFYEDIEIGEDAVETSGMFHWEP